MGPVAEPGDGGQQLAEVCFPGVPDQSGPRRGRIDIKRRDAGQLIQCSFDQPAAGGAAHAFDLQRRFPLSICIDTAYPLEQGFPVVRQPFGADNTRVRLIRRDARGGSELVVFSEAGITDKFCDSFATRTANRQLIIVNKHQVAIAGDDRFAAVKAGFPHGRRLFPGDQGYSPLTRQQLTSQSPGAIRWFKLHIHALRGKLFESGNKASADRLELDKLIPASQRGV